MRLAAEKEFRKAEWEEHRTYISKRKIKEVCPSSSDFGLPPPNKI